MIPLSQDLPLPKEGGGDRRLPLSPRPEALPALLGKKGVSECWGSRGGARGVPSLPSFLLLLEPHGFQALGAGDEGDVPPLLH